jgi:hypothetical protein
MGEVIPLRSKEQLDTLELQKSLRSLNASGIDGLWLREQLLMLCSDREIADADIRALDGYNLLSADGKAKNAVRTMVLCNCY